MMFVVAVKRAAARHYYVGLDGSDGSITVALRFPTYEGAETEADRWRSPRIAAWVEEVPCRAHGMEDCPAAKCHRWEQPPFGTKERHS